MSFYPNEWHPVFFLIDSLQAIGINAQFAKDERTLDCWGMVFPDYDHRVLVWLIDNRIPHERMKEDPAAKELLKRGAIVAHAQKPDMSRVGGTCLPLAASPGFMPLDCAKTANVAFVGYIRDEGRARMLADVGKRFSLNLAQGVFGKDAVATYCSASVGVNIVSHYGQEFAYDSFNMRSPEIMACGVPLVTEYQPYLSELGLMDLETYVQYGKGRTITEAIQLALKHPEIGLEGAKLIQEEHTYRHRAETVKQWLSE